MGDRKQFNCRMSDLAVFYHWSLLQLLKQLKSLRQTARTTIPEERLALTSSRASSRTALLLIVVSARQVSLQDQ